MNKLLYLFLKFRIKYLPHLAKINDYNKILKMQGVEVGDNTIFYSPSTITVDVSRPFMLKIGDYCKITSGVTILCHDYSRSVCINTLGLGNVGDAGMTIIEDNCFIGMNAIILMGAHIGKNSIVGAGSVVSGEFPENVVIAGNPAKIICSLEEFYNKRKKVELDKAILFAKSFKNKYDVWPNIYEMTNAFAWMYLKHDKSSLDDYTSLFSLNGVEKGILEKNFLGTNSLFNSYEEFIEYCSKH